MVQLVAYAFTDVLVLLALSFDRLSDVLISLFFLVSLSVSLRPADSLHAFGHTRVQNVAALVVSGILILFLSLETFREAITELLDPSLVETSDLDIAAAVTVLSMIAIAVPMVALKMGGREGVFRSQLINLVLDEFSCGISLVAIALTAGGHGLASPAGSMVVGAAILLTGLLLFRENAAILVGQAPSGELEDRLLDIALSVKGVKGVHGLRAEMVGPDTVHADLHIEIAPETTVAAADIIAEEVRERIEDATNCRYCEVHMDPYRPDGPGADR